MITKHCEVLKELNIEPKTILEIGSRDGDDAAFYASQFSILPDLVYVVEPNPLMTKKIKEKYPDFNIFEVAIDDGDEVYKEFNQVVSLRKDPIGVSSLLDRNDDFYTRFPTNKIMVKTMNGITLMNIIDKEIDICKVDVEGLTYEVLKSFGNSIKKIKTLHIETETHPYWKGQKLHQDVVQLLEKLNFKLIWRGEESYNQIDSIWMNNDKFNDKFNDVEIHTLICNRDVLLGVNNFKSLQKFEEFNNVPIFLHDDGSLTSEDIKILSEIKNVEIISRQYADEEIGKYLQNYPNCMRYRLGNHKINLWHKIKSFDYFFFSKTKKILGVDSDLLFIQKPNDVINYIISDIPFYFPDVQSAYCFNKPKNEIPVIENVNTGLIYIPSGEYYHIDAIEHALENLIRENINYFPSWIEQSAYAHMFYVDGRYKSLSIEKYKIPYFQSVDIKMAECLHFVSYPAVRETYKTYIDYLGLNFENIIYTNNFIVKFESHLIPLSISIKMGDSMMICEFYWGLEKTNHNMLDHIFRIKTDEDIQEYKFQSEKNGFFIINSRSFELYHTYDWFGSVEWIKLDNINI